MRRIVILGNGFAALHAAQELESALEGRPRLELMVVAESNEFIYSPLFPHAVGGALAPSALSFPYDESLAPETRLEIDPVRGIDVDEREIVGSGDRYGFDYLVIAPRSRTDWGDAESCRDGESPDWTRDGVCRIREHVERRIESGDDPGPPIAVVGAGPAGVELASEIGGVGEADRDERIPVAVVERRDCILPDAPESLRRAVRAHFRSTEVDVRTERRAAACRPEGLELQDGTTIEAELVVWCGGVRPPEIGDLSSIERDQQGRIPVDESLSVPGAPGVYAAGGMAAPPDAPPLRAHLAAGQGRCAARNVRADLSGRGLEEWSPEDDSWLLSLGSTGAAVLKGESLITGRAARILYRLRHASWMPDPLATSDAARAWLEAVPG